MVARYLLASYDISMHGVTAWGCVMTTSSCSGEVLFNDAPASTCQTQHTVPALSQDWFGRRNLHCLVAGITCLHLIEGKRDLYSLEI